MVNKFSLIIGIFLLFSISSVQAFSGMWEVSSKSDDAHYRGYPRQIQTDVNTVLECGDFTGSYYDYKSGMRFAGINISQGAIIETAYLQMRAKELTYYVPQTYVIGEDTGNANSFSSIEDFENRNRTSANISWYPSPWSGWVTSPDISSIIQEIVNRRDWSSGNALVLFWEDEEGCGQPDHWATAYAYLGYVIWGGSPSDYAPKLNISWHPLVCGDNICDYSETSITCCSDCGALAYNVCIDNENRLAITHAILPLLVGVGIILWSIKTVLTSPNSAEKWIAVIISLAVAITLLGILVGVV